MSWVGKRIYDQIRINNFSSTLIIPFITALIVTVKRLDSYLKNKFQSNLNIYLKPLYILVIVS